MAGTPYSVLYDAVIAQIKDYVFAEMSDSEVYEILSAYIRPAVVRFQSSKSDLGDRDAVNECFHADLSDAEIEILARFMVVEYLDANYIRVPSLLKSVLTSKDFQLYSPANQLDKMLALRDRYVEENRQLMRDYSYRDSELFAPRDAP